MITLKSGRFFYTGLPKKGYLEFSDFLVSNNSDLIFVLRVPEHFGKK